MVFEGKTPRTGDFPSKTVGAVVLALVVLVGCGGDDAEAPTLTEAQAESAVRDYVAAVHEGDYANAARFLTRGDTSLDARPDLVKLGVDAATVDAVAEGLDRYCQPSCAALSGVDLDGPDSQSYTATVEFGEPRGHPLQRSFAVGVDADGKPYVQGLPPAGDGAIGS